MEDLKNLIKKMDKKLDTIDTRLNRIDVTLVKQNSELEHHIYRTELAEKRLELIQSEVTPLTKLREQINGAFRLIGIIGTIVGLCIGAAKLVIDLI